MGYTSTTTWASRPSGGFKYDVWPRRCDSMIGRSLLSFQNAHPVVVADLCCCFCFCSYPIRSINKVRCIKLTAFPGTRDFFRERAPTPILDMVEAPMDLNDLSTKELKHLADEIRSEISFTMSKTIKHCNASLGTVELSIAIHHVFNAPLDKILWDVGEQTYAHKILTGRRFLMHTLKQKDGISGFTNRKESDYDAFGAGHGCNSISSGLGMAVARDLKVKSEHIVAVISNWTTMAGQVYEAMSNAGYLDSNVIIILNDSRHSLHPKLPEGQKMMINALSSTLSKIQSSKSFRTLREAAKGVTKRIGKRMHEWAAKVDEYARGMIGPPGVTLFEELGLYYIGPVDGHDIDDLICVLREVASMDPSGPVLIHVVTEEDGGTQDIKDEMSPEMQGMWDLNPSTTSSKGNDSSLPRTYSDCFAEALGAEAEKDENIVFVYAGMGMDPSIQTIQSRFSERFFDVGMAEQHAVTFAAGLACGGLKPFCIIPSTFLQRAYDQVGKGRILSEGEDVALLGYGVMVQNCLKAQRLLSTFGVQVTVADARFCKPLDMDLVRQICKNHGFLITVEEATVGGFGSHVAQFMALDGLLDGRVKIKYFRDELLSFETNNASYARNTTLFGGCERNWSTFNLSYSQRRYHLDSNKLDLVIVHYYIRLKIKHIWEGENRKEGMDLNDVAYLFRDKDKGVVLQEWLNSNGETLLYTNDGPDPEIAEKMVVGVSKFVDNRSGRRVIRNLEPEESPEEDLLAPGGTKKC